MFKLANLFALLFILQATILEVSAKEKAPPKPQKCGPKFWKHSIFPEIKKAKKKVVQLTSKIYDEKVVNPESGEFISNRPWFIIFVSDPMFNCEPFKYMLQHSAKEYAGKIQFAFTYADDDEALAGNFKVNRAQLPAMFYLAPNNHTYQLAIEDTMDKDKIKAFIDKGYKDVPRFGTPSRSTSTKWVSGGNFYDNALQYYQKSLQSTVEGYMKDQKIGYYVDLGARDKRTGQKLKRETHATYTERQFTFVAWIAAFASSCSLWMFYLIVRIWCIKDDPDHVYAPLPKRKGGGCCGDDDQKEE